jgi:hypothetical protein
VCPKPLAFDALRAPLRVRSRSEPGFARRETRCAAFNAQRKKEGAGGGTTGSPTT